MTTKESSTEPTQPRQLDPLAAIPSSLTEIDQTLEKISSIMGGISESLYASDLTNPLGYRLARIAAWLPVEKAPPAQENQTMIPPPNSQLLDALTSLQNDQANEDIVRFAETQLQRNPYWLDLNRICAEALNRIGALDAQREVTAATQHFSKRVPEITGLFFSNGMSFADAQTLTWLENQDGTETNNANEKYLQNAIRTARSMALDGNLGEAADFLQKQLNQTTSLRDKLLLRVSLCELLLTQHPAGNLLPFAIAIIADIDRFQLTEWDPVLAIKGLKAAYLVMSRNNGDIKEANKLLAKIIQLDAGSAVRLII